MIGGWFAGEFIPSAYNTSLFEAGVKEHKKGEAWPTHYHTVHEINYLAKGKMKINKELLVEGDIFIIPPMETITPDFLEDCLVFTIKTPAKLNDKYIV